MKLTISLGQLAVRPGQPEAGFERVRAWVAEAARRGSALIVLPELWHSGYDLENWRRYASPLGEGIFARVSTLAQEQRIAIAGSMLEDLGDRAGNTLVIFDDQGRLSAAYRKTHLFPLLDENRYLAAGERLNVAPMAWGVTGLALCYDLRFPEVFRRYALDGSRLVILPAQWPASRIAHWRFLLHARAIENQFFLAACNAVGQIPGGTLGGSSTIIDPWGESVIAGGMDEVLLTAEIDLDYVAEVRRRLPVWDSRRPEIY